MTLPPFDDWSDDQRKRWLHAAQRFGLHLMSASHDYAIDRIPADATPRERELATAAARDAIYGMMMLFDGVADSDIDSRHSACYKLIAEIILNDDDRVVADFELAPDGDGLCMGYHGWLDSNFSADS